MLKPRETKACVGSSVSSICILAIKVRFNAACSLVSSCCEWWWCVTAAVDSCLVFMSLWLVRSGCTQRQQIHWGKKCSSMTSLLREPAPATFPTNVTAAWPWKAQLSSKDILPSSSSNCFSSVCICEKPRDREKEHERKSRKGVMYREWFSFCKPERKPGWESERWKN